MPDEQQIQQQSTEVNVHVAPQRKPTRYPRIVKRGLLKGQMVLSQSDQMVKLAKARLDAEAALHEPPKIDIARIARALEMLRGLGVGRADSIKVIELLA